jgi:hypothetical protein
MKTKTSTRRSGTVRGDKTKRGRGNSQMYLASIATGALLFEIAGRKGVAVAKDHDGYPAAIRIFKSTDAIKIGDDDLSLFDLDLHSIVVRELNTEREYDKQTIAGLLDDEKVQKMIADYIEGASKSGTVTGSSLITSPQTQSTIRSPWSFNKQTGGDVVLTKKVGGQVIDATMLSKMKKLRPLNGGNTFFRKLDNGTVLTVTYEAGKSTPWVEIFNIGLLAKISQSAAAVSVVHNRPHSAQHDNVTHFKGDSADTDISGSMDEDVQTTLKKTGTGGA